MQFVSEHQQTCPKTQNTVEASLIALCISKKKRDLHNPVSTSFSEKKKLRKVEFSLSFSEKNNFNSD